MSRTCFADATFLLALLLILIFSAGGHLVAGDEETMFRVTQNLVTQRSLAVGKESVTLPSQPPPFQPRQENTFETTSAVPGRDGRRYAKYGIGQSLAAIPLFWLGNLGDSAAATRPAWPTGWLARLAVSMFNPLMLFVGAWLFLLLGRAMGFKPATTRWLAAGLLFTTMAWPYVKTFYPQPAVMSLLLLVVYAAVQWNRTRGRKWLLLLGGGLFGIILFRASALIVLPVICAYLFFTTPPRQHRAWGIAVALSAFSAIALTLVYNWLRFGNMLDTGYREVAWTTPFLLGLYGLLFSPGKGIIFYAPLILPGTAALFPFAKKHRAETLLFGGLWAAFLLFYSPYNFWTGGFNWGPRFLLPLLPFAILPAGTLMERTDIPWAQRGTAVFLLVGFLIQFPAVLVDHSRYLGASVLESDTPAESYARTVFTLPASPVIRQWPVAVDLLDAYRHSETWAQAHRQIAVLQQRAPDSPNASALLVSEFLRQNTIDFWWIHLWMLH